MSHSAHSESDAASDDSLPQFHENPSQTSRDAEHRSQLTEPPQAPTAAAHTPHKSKPSGVDSNLYKEATRGDNTEQKNVWKRMLPNEFAGVVPIEKFLEDYLPKCHHERSSKIASLVGSCKVTLDASIAALGKTKVENDMSQPLINYLQQVVSGFPQNKKPIIADTHNTRFPALDGGGRYTMPDITSSRPGISKAPINWDWSKAGTIIELKYKTLQDVIDSDGNLKTSEESQNALVQLSKSARSLLKGSRSCVVYVVSVFACRMARIFRFDRAGFRASTAFDWTKDTAVFPKFFWRLYNPSNPNATMCGADDTLSIPSQEEKKRMYDALCKNSFYEQQFPTLLSATNASLWIRAVRSRTDADDKVVSEPVKCFTIGAALSSCDGLFSRATLVYRVILEEDIDSECPTIYALKDSWRQRCRRPEVDFYDTIAKHCELKGINMDEKGMARCHGSVDLSVATSDLVPDHDPAYHSTCSSKLDEADLERCHMRTLLTPVGVGLHTFKCTKDFAQALLTAIEHHEIANAAGILHRDVSEGNVLFQEICHAIGTSRVFLMDWDYAEFTSTGLQNFKKWFPERVQATEDYDNIEKSLKDLTGTLPFLAIELMSKTPVQHEGHHDLESFYWLFLWCILRYTAHTHNDGPHACRNIFTSGALKGFVVQQPVPIEANVPLHNLAENLADTVADQIRRRGSKPIEYANFINIFRTELGSQGWPTDDAALDFIPPPLVTLAAAAEEAKSRANQSRANQSLRQTAIEQSAKRSGKRKAEADASGAPLAAAGGSGSASKKRKTASGTVEVLDRGAARSGGAAQAPATKIVRARGGSTRSAGPSKNPSGKRNAGSGGSKGRRSAPRA
ncbi:hypothetical protein B0H15DRAFT_800539 [Mycena belliarum]|uniref:Fungal-type protein kinase domain-containing protein n=1 Tax=Mycena belliarum TaxID=1033014 RepID=A0AAD6U3Z4_9AGAR|nr:hypothetical protein B0H15DRAFT_800539 [Mycena belliae]